MAVTTQELSAHLEALGMRHEVREDEDLILTGFRTKRYVNPTDGEHGIIIVVQLFEDGEYIKIFSPRCYQYPPDGEHAAAVFQALLFISWCTKLVQFEYDPSDGEIRAMVEWPVEDGTVTKRQLARALSGLAEIVDLYDPVVRTAIEGGGFRPAMAESAMARMFLEMLERTVSEIRRSLEEQEGDGDQPPDDEEPLDLEE